MAGLLTDKTIMLLARKRLTELRADLARKVAAPNARITNIEKRVLYLATRAVEMLSAGPPPSNLEPPPPLVEGISKFAVLGSAGPNITGAEAAFGPGRDWMYHTLHAGTSDPNRERVVARTTDFLLAFVGQISTAVTSAHLGDTDATNALQAMNAYALGYACHVAGDLVTHPFIDDIVWQRGPGTQPPRALVPGVAGSLDARVAIEVFDRPSPREGEPWTVHWPTPADVPAPLWSAFVQAFQDVYGLTPAAGSAEHEELAAPQNRPAVSTDLLRQSYDFYYHGVVGIQYGFAYWDFLATLLPLAITFVLELGLAPVVASFRKGFTTAPWDLPSGGSGDSPTERAVFDLFAFPLLITSAAELFYAIWACALTHRSVGGLTVLGIIAAAISFIAMVVYFATLGTSNHDFSPTARWLLLFVIPLLGPVAFFVVALIKGRTAVGFLATLFALPLFMMLAGLILYFAWFLPLGAAGAALGFGTGGLVAEYVVAAVLAAIGLICGWLGLARWLQNALLPEMADANFAYRRGQIRVSRLPTDRPSLVRLFDETTLFQEIAGPPPPVDRKRQRFPAGRRKLIKLWWDGAPAGTVFVRSDRYALVFSAHADGSAPVTVNAPLLPSTIAEVVASFNDPATVALAGTPGHLQAAPAYPGDLDYELPPGATFSDHGDDQETTSGHDRAAATFVPLGAANDAQAYVLFHAPQAAQAIRYGRKGAVRSDEREDESIPGDGTLATHGTTVTGTNTLFAQFFVVGDILDANGEKREITLVRSHTEMVIASGFEPDLPAGTAFTRHGGELERKEGWNFTSQTVGGPAGDAILDNAADLASLLCLALVPHLEPLNQAIPGLPTDAPGGNNSARVVQVFRNWNLDRRRVNEWRELIAGGARDESAGNSSLYGATLPDPRPTPADPRREDVGMAAAQRLGWVPLLRRFATLVQRGGDLTNNNAAADQPDLPADASRMEVLRGLSYLLDMPEPALMP